MLPKGKTTLSKRLQAALPNCTYLTQDDFYFPRDRDHLPYIEELDSLNFDVISAIDVDKFLGTLGELVASNKFDYILLDGFLLYEDKRVYELCDKKFFLLLNKEECLRRRLGRNYVTEDKPHYFDKVVWLEFLNYKKKCQVSYDDIVYMDGSDTVENIFNSVFNDIKAAQ